MTARLLNCFTLIITIFTRQRDSNGRGKLHDLKFITLKIAVLQIVKISSDRLLGLLQEVLNSLFSNKEELIS